MDTGADMKSPPFITEIYFIIVEFHPSLAEKGEFEPFIGRHSRGRLGDDISLQNRFSGTSYFSDVQLSVKRGEMIAYNTIIIFDVQIQ